MSGETLAALYAEACALLDSRFEAAQLFGHVTGASVPELVRIGASPAPTDAARRLRGLCAQRRAGVPLQYLLGEWEFYGLTFKVGRGVLIPRADTETLVDVAVELGARWEKPEILDLCSGTGCVAIATARHLPTAAVTALELSTEAFPYLRENIARIASSVSAVQADLREYTHPRALDLITCNPPYIPADEIAGLQRELRFEPRRALDGGPDGLDLYRVIAARYAPQLKSGGWLALEIGAGQEASVAELLAENGFGDIRFRRDFGGIVRVVYARREKNTIPSLKPN